MRKAFFTICMFLAACYVQAAKNDVSQLTLEEKIGQMMQLVTDIFGTNDAEGVFHIDKAKADTLFSKYKIGSILNAPNTCAPTALQWEEIISDIQRLSLKYIGIPCIFGLDQNHGSTYTQGGTLFPQRLLHMRHVLSVYLGRSARPLILDVMPVGLAFTRTLARTAI